MTVVRERPGKAVEVEYLRNGYSATVNLTLGDEGSGEDVRTLLELQTRIGRREIRVLHAVGTRGVVGGDRQRRGGDVNEAVRDVGDLLAVGRPGGRAPRGCARRR